MENIPDEPSHPLQIALRTYSLCLSLALSPVLLSTILASAVRPKNLATYARTFARALLRELRPTGFASAITAAAGGGAALQRLWNVLERQPVLGWSWIHYINSKSSLCQRTFLANVISSTFAVTLLRWKRYRRLGTVSPTLDLTLLFLVRALDALVQRFLIRKARRVVEREVQASSRDDVALRASDTRLLDKQPEDLANLKEWKNRVSMHLDALIFWAGSARFVNIPLCPRYLGHSFLHQRIMWCFFYQPRR